MWGKEGHSIQAEKAKSTCGGILGWAWERLRNKEESTAMSVTRGLEKHWGSDYTCNGMLTALSHPHFPYSPPTPNLFFPVSSLVLYLSWLPSSSSHPHSALSHSRFLSASPHRRNALLFNDALQFTKLFGIHDLINLTTTLIGRCCPHSADDENEVKGDEVTWPKPHKHVTAEASVGLCSFLQISLHLSNFRLSLRYLRCWLALDFPWTEGTEWSLHLRTLKDGHFVLEKFLEKVKGEFVSVKVVLTSGEILF